MLQQINRISSPEVVIQAPIILVPNFVIGRQQTSNLVLLDAVLSRKHCVLSLENNEWFVEDSSNNGVWRRKSDSDCFQRLDKNTKYLLHDKDELKLSETLFYKFISKDRPATALAVEEEPVKKPLGHSSANSNENSLEGFAAESVSKKLQLAEESESRSQRELEQRNLVNDYEKKIETLKSQLDSAKIQAELAIQNEKESSAAITRTLRLELDLERHVLEKEKERSERILCELNSLKLSAASEVLRLKTETEECKNKCKHLEKECEALTDKKRIIEEEKKTIEGKKQALEREKQTLEKEIQSLEKEKQALETRVVQVEAGIDFALENQLEKFEELLESEAQCAICFEMVIKPASLNCGHVFCEKCIEEWKIKTPRCPTCRAKIKRLTRVTMVDSFLAKMTDNLTDDFKRKRSQVIEERGGNDGNVVPPKRQCTAGVHPFFVQAINTPIPEPLVFIDLTTTPNRF